MTVISGTPYPAPIYLLNAVSTSQTSAVLDIGSCTARGIPPVLLLTISSSATVVIEGSHDTSLWAACPTSFTASDARDLIIGIRFWRVVATIVSGTVTASVGAVPSADGNLVIPNLLTLTNNPTAGA